MAYVKSAGADLEERRKVGRMLGDWHSDAVLDLPGPELGFHAEAAVWGGILLFRAACLLCFREIGEHEIRELLHTQGMPGEADPAAHFSADLCLRHWPELLRMARAQSEDDPLVGMMSDLSVQFPLSTMAMPAAGFQTSPVFLHPGLRQFFAERALERSHHATLALPEIGTLVRSKLGRYSSSLGGGLLSHTPES